MSTEAADRAPPARSGLTYFLGQNVGLVLAIVMLVVAVVLYCAVYWIEQQALPGNFEITSTVNNTMPLVLAAMGQAFVVLTRGLDLSVGGIMDLANALAAVHIHDSHRQHGRLEHRHPGDRRRARPDQRAAGRRRPPAADPGRRWRRCRSTRGWRSACCRSRAARFRRSTPSVLVNPYQPYALLYVLLVAFIWYAFRRSRIGVAIFAIGNDEQAARANGIDTVRARVTAFTLSGLMSGAAGLFLAATATAGDATTGNGYTLSSIVAVVLGGMNLFGGRGSGVGVIAGAFVTTMIVNILFFSNIDPLYQSFYEGLFLVVAVVLGTLIGRLLRRRP